MFWAFEGADCYRVCLNDFCCGIYKKKKIKWTYVDCASDCEIVFFSNFSISSTLTSEMSKLSFGSLATIRGKFVLFLFSVNLVVALLVFMD